MTRGQLSRSSWLVLFVALVACQSPRSATQVLVLVDAQPLIRADAARVEIVVRAGTSTAALVEEPYRMTDPGPVRWPRDITLVPFGGDASRVYEVEANALDASDHVIAQARLRGGFVEHQARSLRLILEDRCRGVTCSDGFTCHAGHCMPIVEPGQDGGVPDLDGGVGDAAMPCGTDAECDDHVFCNGAERCVMGACAPGDIVSCDDGVACTDDLCEGTGCVHTPNAMRCTAGPDPVCDPTNDCQYSVCDTTTCTPGPCQSASCSGTTCLRTSRCGASEMCCGSACVPRGCADTDPCTDDACDTATSSCTHAPDTGARCDDGNACTTSDTCSAGRCTGGGATSCDDANDCTTDSCQPATGCAHDPAHTGSACSDQNPCTAVDDCQGALCVGHGGCDDGIACTVEMCTATGCTSMPLDTLCTALPAGRCDPVAGCQYGVCTPATCAPASACETASCSGATCMRGSACSAGQICCGGACTSCDDGNPCTDDSCGGTGCVHAPNTAACNDASACTTGDHCSAGACVGTPLTCNDGNPCTTDSCTAGGGCAFAPAPDASSCDDGDACTSGDRCVAGHCQSTGATLCNDNNDCTTDSCAPATGCVYTPRDFGTECGIYSFDTCIQPTCDGAGFCQPNTGCAGGTFCCQGVCSPRGDCMLGGV